MRILMSLNKKWLVDTLTIINSQFYHSYQYPVLSDRFSY